MPGSRARSRLRVAMVAPPWFPVPPDGYGGIESVVAVLVDRLVAHGHDVTLLAAGEHGTKAQRFMPIFGTPPSEEIGTAFTEVWFAARVGAALRQLDVDVIHDHSLAGLLTAEARNAPTLHTAHNPVHARFGDYLRCLVPAVRPVALSQHQMRAAPDLPWAGHVPNGIDVSQFPYRATKSDYLLFLGRIVPEKGAHLAVDAARASGHRIVIAGKCQEPAERAYFEREIRPRIGADAKWVGPADFATKTELLSMAAALICAFQWEEPLPTVLIEAMACGTPIVATRCGSTSELVVNGVTGHVVGDVTELPDAIAGIPRIDPAACRRRAETHLSADQMATRYETLYQQILCEHAAQGSGRPRKQRGAWVGAS